MLLWNRVPNPVFNPSTGERAGGAKAYFTVGGTTTPLAVYTTDAGDVPHTNPVVADANGVFPPIFIPYGPFGYRVTTATGTIISPTVSTVQNPAPPDSGGGGGIVVTQDQVFNTGDTKWVLDTDNRAGWVLMNDGTIGNVGSGASLRANPDTESLFIYLFNKLSNTYAPVSGGRTTAEADYAANKTIVVPTMASYLAGCIDNLSGSAANRLQRSTTISTTNLSTSATVASASGLVIGMKVVSTNVPAGATITDISGATITLSANATATASGVAARFSMFDDAQVPGAVGGLAQKSLVTKEIPVITPTASNSFSDTALGSVGTTTVDGSLNTVTVVNTVNSKALSYTPTINPFGGGLAHSLIQPTRLGAWFMKL